MKLKQVLLVLILIVVLVAMLGVVTYKYLELKEENKRIAAENLELTTQIEKLDSNTEETKKLQEELDLTEETLEFLKNRIESEIDGFVTGYYSYEYVEIMEEGEPSEWELELSMGFHFLNDGSVYGSLPGHESGSLVGTYEISEKEIKCKFTEYENECSATYGLKLDQEGEVVLTRLNENELKVLTWIKKPMVEDSDLSYGEEEIFTVNLVQRY